MSENFFNRYHADSYVVGSGFGFREELQMMCEVAIVPSRMDEPNNETKFFVSDWTGRGIEQSNPSRMEIQLVLAGFRVLASFRAQVGFGALAGSRELVRGRSVEIVSHVKREYHPRISPGFSGKPKEVG